jgi:hypothetical protein
MGDTDYTTAWGLARLGNAIDVYVDRQLGAQSQTVMGQTGYGIDASGNLYQLGQTASGATVTRPAQPNVMLLALIGLGIYMLAKS